MRYGHHMICINPTSPMQPVGFSSKKRVVSLVRGDLYARCLYLHDKQKILFLTLDSLGVSHDVHKRLEKEVHKSLGYDVHVIISCTHTHYAPSLANAMGFVDADETYIEFVCSRLRVMLNKMPIKEGDLEISVNSMPFNEIGRNRLSSGNDKYVILTYVAFFSDKRPIGNWIIYNCHPTISAEDAPYFSSDYVGVALEDLKKAHPNEFAMFFQGPGGDVSTRFTRKDKSYQEALRFGRILSHQISEFQRQKPDLKEVSLHFLTHHLTLSHHIKDGPTRQPSKMSEKEEREYRGGLALLKKISKHPEHLLPTAHIEQVSLGAYSFFFVPFELFSSYNRYLKKNSFLIGYSQGMGSYVTDVKPKVESYESIIETISEQDKEQLILILRQKASVIEDKETLWEVKQ